MKDAEDLDPNPNDGPDGDEPSINPQTVQDMLKAFDGLGERMGLTAEKLGILSQYDAIPEWAKNPSVFTVAEPIVPKLPPSPMIEQGARTARNTEEMRQHLALLVDASRLSLEQSMKTETFTRRMSIASLWISIGSLAAALGSIVVAIIALVLQASSSH